MLKREKKKKYNSIITRIERENKRSICIPNNAPDAEDKYNNIPDVEEHDEL